MVVYCTVCMNNNRKTKNISYFNYPKESTRRTAFLRAVGREDLIPKLDSDPKVRQMFRICEEHFEKSCIKYSKNRTVKYLYKDAFPTLNLKSNDDSSSSSNDIGIKMENVDDGDFEEGTLRADSMKTAENVTDDFKIEEDEEIGFKIKQEPSTSSEDGYREWEQTGGANGYDHFQRKLNAASATHTDGMTRYTVYTQTELDIRCDKCYKNVHTLSSSTSEASVQTEDLESASQAQPAIFTSAGQNLDNQHNCKCKQRKRTEHDVPELTNCIKNIIKRKKALGRVYRGKQYDTEYKLMAMKFLLASPAAYRLLHRTLNLPSENELRRAKINISTNLSDDALACLQAKADRLSGRDKICVLYAGEMLLNRNLFYQINNDRIFGFNDVNETQKSLPANRAFAIMARGLFAEWKQPLAYCFLSRSDNHAAELSAWLDIIIRKVIDVGYYVVALTMGHGAGSSAIAEYKAVSREYPFFHVKGRKIYYIFDAPHLLSCIGADMMKYDFVYDNIDGEGGRASWRDIQNLYDVEKKRSYRMARELTEEHVRPQRRRQGAALAVFSHSVADALSGCAELRLLPASARGTAALIRLFRDMLDVLNSAPGEATTEYTKPFAQEKHQVELLEKVLSFLNGVRVVDVADRRDVTHLVKGLKNLEVTIAAVLKLSTALRTFGCDSLFTRRLNRDDLDRFFLSLRRHGPLKPVRFALVFRRRFVRSLFGHVGRPYRDDDLPRLVAAIAAGSTKQNNVEIKSRKEEVPVLTVGTTDYRFQLPRRNSLHFVCKYLLLKCYEVHKKCGRMEEYVDDIESEVTAMIALKKYIKQMDDVVVAIFRRGDVLLPARIGNRILEQTKNVKFVDQPCRCFPTFYLRKLFVRFRIFNILQHNNRRFKKKSREQNHIEVPDLKD